MIRSRAEVTVERARVRRAQPGSRAQLEGALARLSPAAIGVPPGALLLIRRLAPRARLGPGMHADALVADLHETLRERLAHARARGAGGDGDDLLFRDDADLAAAVIASWLDGNPPSACAWRTLVTGGEPPPAWWRRAVLPDARLLPRVIAALARQRRAAEWVARLDPHDVRGATRLLAAAHGIALPDRFGQAPTVDRPPASTTAKAGTLRAALHALVSEAFAPASTIPQRALIALALVLHRRPALVRAAGFAPAFTTLVAGPAEDAERTLPVSLPPTSPPIPAVSTQEEDPPAPATQRPGIAATAHEPIRSPRPAAAEHADTAVDTHFGGLFFLLAALIAMDVYGDFTRPLAVPIAPDPFDLLALLGRRWFGTRFRRDPVDALLATLAGRGPGEPIRFTPPCWHVPATWLDPWPPVRGGEGWHPAGFPLDLAADHPGLPVRPLARWSAALALYLQARLARALDVGPRQAVSLTCRRPASIRCTGDRVSVTFALASHPLALRLAGLDRDPGYIPAARRDVRFVFA